MAPDAQRTRRPAPAPVGSGPAPVAVAPPVPRGRLHVLYAVRRGGDATVEGVATDLGITVSGARQHLAALAADGLVGALSAGRQPGQRGRARLHYHVTALGDTLFPKAYGALTNELLGYLAELDPAAVDRLFARRRDHRIEATRARLAGQPSLADRVAELSSILDGDGYLASWEHLGPNRFLLVEHNCAIADVARRFPPACGSELEFIRAVLPDAAVTRRSHMVAGDRRCAYEICAA